MGKKGSWFAVIIRFFTPSSKDKVVNGTDKKPTREKKKWSSGKAKHEEINSFIPRTRRPSSTEKILADAERELQHRPNQIPPRKIQQLSVPAERSAKFQAGSSKTAPPVTPNHAQASAAKFQPGPSTQRIPMFLNHAQVSATKIQAAYRAYRARRNYRSLKALLRLQAVMRGQGVKQQTTNTIQCMQKLVRVQLQIRAGRLQMAERRSAAKVTARKVDKDFDGSFSKWSTGPDHHNGPPEGRWDDSMLTKEEAAARLRRKVEAVMNRERALAYAYSQQLLKVTPSSARAMLTDLRSARSFPWWWTWLERQIPSDQHRPGDVPASAAPSRPSSALPHFGHDASMSAHHRRRHVDAATPRSTVTISSAQTNLQRPCRRSYLDGGLRDDASLTSCPPFAGAQPNYMTPTASAAAKVRAQRQEGSRDKKKRFAFVLGQSIGSLFATKETSAAGAGATAGGTQRATGRGGNHHRTTSSIGAMSVDSAMSLPVASFGRRHL